MSVGGHSRPASDSALPAVREVPSASLTAVANRSSKSSSAKPETPQKFSMTGKSGELNYLWLERTNRQNVQGARPHFDSESARPKSNGHCSDA